MCELEIFTENSKQRIKPRALNKPHTVLPKTINRTIVNQRQLEPFALSAILFERIIIFIDTLQLVTAHCLMLCFYQLLNIWKIMRVLQLAL